MRCSLAAELLPEERAGAGGFAGATCGALVAAGFLESERVFGAGFPERSASVTINKQDART